VAAKTDVDYKIRLEEAPSIELRDWMHRDLIVYLWESRPKFEKIVEEGTDVEVERVVINAETELPEIETINRGVSTGTCVQLTIFVFSFRF
jgi:hypothetical protein